MRLPFAGSLFAAALALTCAVRAQTPVAPVIDLWPEGVPNLKANGGPEKDEGNGRVSNIQHPSLTVFKAGHPNGAAVIVCPGGGYVRLSFEHEGVEVAQWLNSLGVTAFVIKNRLVEYGAPAPLQDICRAIRTVRAQAADYGIDAKRVGVIGFSAGGHLAASAATLYEDAEGRTGKPIDAFSARPDFAMLVYPVITMEDPYAHKGSRTALLGKEPTREQIDHYSLEKQVNAQTPPCFLIATEEDKTVPPQNSLMFYEALRKAGVSAELHLFEHGPHGFGLRKDLGPTSEWPQRAAEWMRSHGWIPASS